MSMNQSDPDMLDEDGFSRGIRGKYAQRDAESLTETEHLLQSPRNAERLLAALNRTKAGTTPPQTIDELRQEVGLSNEE